MTDSKCGHDHSNPFAPIKTDLPFKFLLQMGGGTLRCGLCGYNFPLDAEDSKHECKQPLFEVTEMVIQPLPMPPMALVFYEDYKVEEALDAIAAEPSTEKP